MNISYNWLKDLVEFDLSPQQLAQRLTGVGLAVEGVHQAGDDFVLDVDLTSNRPDCLSHLGVAREIAAIANSKFQISDFKSEIPNAENNGQRAANKIESLTSVAVEDAELCPRYTARVVQGVKIAASPEWLVKRLEAIGQRSINNVADITNYVMHELGQPLHAFDFDKLAGQRIVVRRARRGENLGAVDEAAEQQININDDLYHSRMSERLVTLDNVERELDNAVLVIADAEKPVAIAGVMGGADSGISDGTTNVLIEAAYFDRRSIRLTSRKLGLATEASYRFERGVDIEGVLRASNRCVELICEIAGGAATVDAINVHAHKPEENILPLRPKRITELTGLDVELSEIERILFALGFRFKGDGIAIVGDREAALEFVAPTWRTDMEREEDLVEEVARHVGLDKIREELPPAFGAGEYQPTEGRKKALRETLKNLGFDEAISYSFINTGHDERFELLPDLIDEQAAERFVTLQNSIIEGATRMRPTLLAGLLDAVRENFNQGTRDVRLFELGKVFAGFGGVGSLPTEREAFALVVTGGETLENRAQPERELDFYDLKGALEAATDALGISGLEFAAADVKHLRVGQAAEVRAGDERVGTLGRLSDELMQVYKFRAAVYVVEVDLQKLFEIAVQPIVYQSLPRFPTVLRDVTLLVKRNVAFAELQGFIRAQNVELWRDANFVGVYEGGRLADDVRSITLRLEYAADNRTLRDEEVEAAHNKIVRALEERFGAGQ